MADEHSGLNSRYKIVVAAADVYGSTGGIASVSQSVVDALQGAMDDTGSLKVLALHDAAREKQEAAAGSREDQFSGFAGGTSKFSLALCRAALSADCVIATHVRLAVPLMLLPKFLRPKLIVFAHGSESWKRLRPLSRFVFRAADLVLTNSRYTLRHLTQAQPNVTAVDCQLGLSRHIALQTRLPRAHDGPALCLEAANGQQTQLGSRVLLIVGRLDPGEREKGHAELLYALPQIRSRYPDTQIVMAGPGQDADTYRALARELGVADAVFLPGRVSDEDLTQLYRDCYAYVMPSRQEGFGLVYLEAMNWARPCIACRDDGGAEVVSDHETGLLVDQPVAVEALAAAVMALLDDPQLADHMGLEGWARLNAEFTPAQFHARFLSHVGRVLR